MILFAASQFPLRALYISFVWLLVSHGNGRTDENGFLVGCCSLRWSCMQPLKRRWTSTRLQGAKTPKAAIFLPAAIRTWNLTVEKLAQTLFSVAVPVAKIKSTRGVNSFCRKCLSVHCTSYGPLSRHADVSTRQQPFCVLAVTSPSKRAANCRKCYVRWKIRKGGGETETMEGGFCRLVLTWPLICCFGVCNWSLHFC
jgi:hypothetical protein